MMNPNSCFYHADLPAMFVCSRCGRKICASCNKPYSGLTLCPSCYHSVPAAIPVAPATSAPIGAPVGAFAPGPGPVTTAPVGAFGPGWYGPFPKAPLLVRWWWLPAVFVAVAAGLINANAILLLSPGFAFWWSGVLPWGVPLAFNFIIGTILSLILFGAVLMIFLKFKVLAAFIIFPTAIVSIFFGGGGFFGGAILAIIGGLLLLLK